ncbi:MAG: hypothetical protein NUV74_14620 [Candidatus Brocadiaceae bacterium]|nr:hypothetical protein [Candidatus Brocadiaceae bacterium]
MSLYETGDVEMTEEKTEAISYSLPTLVFEKETPWMDLSKLKILANKSFLTNLISEENFVKVTHGALPHTIQPELIMDKIDFDKMFGGFVTVIKDSSFGGMFKLFGGEKALEPLRNPFKMEFERQASEILSNIDIASVLRKETDFGTFKSKISAMVDTTLNELTPQRVKEIVENMMRTHLGWLVVWGGVFVALIGFVSAVFF